VLIAIFEQLLDVNFLLVGFSVTLFPIFLFILRIAQQVILVLGMLLQVVSVNLQLVHFLLEMHDFILQLLAFKGEILNFSLLLSSEFLG